MHAQYCAHLCARHPLMVLTGHVSGWKNVTSAEYVQHGTPGAWMYTFTPPAVEVLNVSLVVSGVVAPSAVTLNVSHVLPPALNATAITQRIALQRDGFLERWRWNASANKPLELSADVWHLVYMPVLRINGSIPQFVANPGLLARVVLVPVDANATTINGSMPGVEQSPEPATMPMQFVGSWSRSNSSYVVPVRVGTAGVYNGVAELLAPNPPFAGADTVDNTTQLIVRLLLALLRNTVDLMKAFMPASTAVLLTVRLHCMQ